MSGVFTQSERLGRRIRDDGSFGVVISTQREKSFQRKVRCALTEPLAWPGQFAETTSDVNTDAQLKRAKSYGSS
jgi:hypothetical protein